VPGNEAEAQGSSGNALLRAILEMREAVTRHVEEFRSLLLTREGPAEVVETAVAPPPPAFLEAEPPTPAPAPVKPPAPVVSVTVDEIPAAGRPEDARQRLEALARLLDKRARQSSSSSTPSAAADRPGEP